MTAIERAADLQTISNNSKGYRKIVVKGVPVEKLYCDVHRSANDTALKLNVLEPRLGDRVVNLTSDGVPFGLRGTVITIHTSTNYVEVTFNLRHYLSKNYFDLSSNNYRNLNNNMIMLMNHNNN